jgi:hypothetical protein
VRLGIVPITVLADEIIHGDGAIQTGSRKYLPQYDRFKLGARSA